MTKKLTISALLVALAMILSYVEVLIPFNFGIPGIKLGLANLVVVVALYLLNARQALMISVVRILLVSFTFGNMAALLYSITGGLLSFAVMVLCRRIKGLSTLSVSVAGGISHNIGQILVAVFVVKNLNLLFYLPVLMIAGIITGLVYAAFVSRSDHSFCQKGTATLIIKRTKASYIRCSFPIYEAFVVYDAYIVAFKRPC